MKFKYFNSNPEMQTFKSGKPKSWYVRDSAIRAISCAIEKDWENVFEQLYTIAKNKHDMIDSKPVVNEMLLSNNFCYDTFGKPTSGQKRPTVEQFVNEYTNGTYVLYLRDYYVCVKDGVLYDVCESTNDSVYSYWKLE